MDNKKTNKNISNLFGSIAAAQTMVEQFPFSFGVNENGFTCSFDILTALFKLISPKESLEEKIIKEISAKLSDPNCTWLQGIEETIKLALETNITNILTCEMSPIIPDNLIGGGEFVKGSSRSFNFSGEGIKIPLSALDFTGLLDYCPSDEYDNVGSSLYFPCYDDNGNPLTVKNLWKHDDFNAFLWYVKNKGVYGSLSERNKLIWDNRYKSKPYTKYIRKPESFFTKENDKYGYVGENGIIPFDQTYLNNYNSDNSNNLSKKQILICKFIDADEYHSDELQFWLPASTYYKTRKLTGYNSQSKILRINKTIFEFNHDFLMSLRLFDAKTYLSQIVAYMFGQGNFTFNFSLTKNDLIISEIIDNIITKVINLDDTEINDCFFNFSNEEYDSMVQNALNKRLNGENTNYLTDDLYRQINDIEFTKGVEATGTTIQIQNVLNQLTKEVVSGENMPNGWQLNYNYQFELIRMLVYPLIRPLFSPKVMTLIYINMVLMGNPLDFSKNNIINIQDILPYLMNVIQNIIITIKDMIVEMLYSWVIEKLVPLLCLYNLRLLMEQVDMYRQLIENTITACMGVSINGKIGIDNVNYTDIDPELEKLKQTNISNTNC